jgi:Arc/MetJ-type ribon-helix-helix transcriptional regulator
MLAQVRLRADETAAMQLAMARLNLSSTSDALREGLRLLSQEAVEVAAAHEIRAFYSGASAPVPDGVLPVSEADLAAADEAEW